MKKNFSIAAMAFSCLCHLQRLARDRLSWSIISSIPDPRNRIFNLP